MLKERREQGNPCGRPAPISATLMALMLLYLHFILDGRGVNRSLRPLPWWLLCCCG